MALERAQEAKHRFMADQLHIKEGSKVLDMGCGWGPFLKYIKEKRRAQGIGLRSLKVNIKLAKKAVSMFTLKMYEQ